MAIKLIRNKDTGKFLFKNESDGRLKVYQTNIGTGGEINIPLAYGAEIDSTGELTFKVPKVSSSSNQPIDMYFTIKVNGTEFTTKNTSINIYDALINGANSVSITTNVLLANNPYDSNIQYKKTFTSLSLLTFYDTVKGTKGINGYTGESKKINISQYDEDGKEITDLTILSSLNVEKIIGKTIYNLVIEEENSSIKQIDFPELKNSGTSFSNLKSLEKVISLNTSKYYSIKNMFLNCSKLKKISSLDTTNVKNFVNAFSGCSSLIEVPELNTTNVTDMSGAFFGCSSLTTIPLLDTSNTTDMFQMFFSCSSLVKIPELNTTNVTDMWGMFSQCSSLTTIPLLDTGNVTNMYHMFYNCPSLVKVSEIDMSKVINADDMFYKCASLKTLLMKNISCRLDISASTKFERSDLVIILMNLSSSSPSTLTVGKENLDKLTDEDKEIATAKGWKLI